MSSEASLLRLLTCGSVDDGKSTLIGRLLYDTKLLLDDQLSSLKQDSRKFGTTGGDFDFALLVDGLEAEREQGITIDVAYRYFATSRRKFIVADTPGHEQYTRNMATGASTSDLAVLLIDARKGVSNQTRRHAYIVSLLGIRHIVLAVNKIDLVEYSRDVFESIIADFQAFAHSLQFRSIVSIPVSARFGDNVISVSAHTPWHTGPSLLDHLEAVDVGVETKHGNFRMPVQWVNRPTLDFRGYAGTIVGGSIKVGETIAVAASGRTSEIKRIVTLGGDWQEANTGDAVTVMLKDEIDISRGDVFCGAKDRPEVSDQFVAHLLWMVDEPLLPGRQYILKLATSTVTAQVTALKHKVDVDNLDRLAAKTLHLNEIGLVNIALGRPIAFDAYDQNRATGGFILIDRYSNATVGAGMVEFGLRRAANVHWQALDINKQVRAQHKAQKPVVLWFTGLSGSGKSTIANLVERMLFENGRHTYLLDGDNVRHGLNRDLGFTQEDRVENIRRIGETAKLFVDAGLIVLVSFISPFKSERQMARDLLPEGEFIEIFINTPFEVCAARDPKGLYKKAMAGQLKNFTGLDSPYEPPQNPDIVINTLETEPAESAERIVRFLSDRGY